MAEFVTLDSPGQNNKLDRDKVRAIIYTYLFNFNLYIFLLLIYDSWLMKGFTFLLINAFASEMLIGKINIKSIGSWSFVFAIINYFAFGLTSFILLYNMVAVMINLIYFRKVLKKVKL